ncbi:proton-translocating NADH-quinone oxidoreductase, chain L [Leptospira alstonii serovar Pingchang str. 80-412]|uniref:Proton-translocating NADH-quinone oxidoreductase, chain L n=3 Tax=Leptospira alstonii TaxID=28452 RepID=M6DE77_9LEPT|nr:proton-translocating NADH-quinone oxidoreductase, chain L [Leptospira alstonii serovar Sichuan str. 79601]EQA81600.1 proton-translocating NADH-quinone oxidoreductase, chain L [Leptospira alstonii serovar Pingchang str. 80-412]
MVGRMEISVLIPALVALPLVGFLISGIFGKWLKEFTGIFSTGVVFLSFVLALVSFVLFHPMERTIPEIVTVFPWISAGGIQVSYAYQVDQLSLYMILIVTGIGFLIHLYSIGYMKGDPGFARYFAYLNLFIFAMLNLVLAENLILLFLGWEGVGLCSYLLIGFDYHKETAADAGMKAFIVNRIGDLGMLLGIALVFWYTGSVSFTAIGEAIPEVPSFRYILPLVAVCFFIGAIGKSAQLPLHVWLPDAMAGPTPVSALIHAATMVTAGIFLIARLNPIFLSAPQVGHWIVIVGSITAFFAATIGLFQNDIKKVLAYSTVSQLGYMFVAMGAGAYVAGLFHLMTHAFFKALLFLGSGSVIHALHHEQDLRNMGGLKNQMKITWITFLVGSLAISGIPPFSGFFSKDLILEKSYAYGALFYGLGIVTALLTAFYMFRMTYLAFYGESRVSSHKAEHLHESPIVMTIPLVILSVGAAIAGFLEVPHFLFGGANILTRYFAPVFIRGTEISEMIVKRSLDVHEVGTTMELGLVAVSVAVAVSGIFIARTIFLTGKKVPDAEESRTGIGRILSKKYYVDEFYHNFIVEPIVILGKFLADHVERNFLDLILRGTGRFAVAISLILRRVQTGIVVDYAILIVLGTVVILSFFLMRGL